MVSVPGVKPNEAVADATFKVAVAVLPDPNVTWLTLPIVCPPVVKVTGPVSVPAVPVAVTVATRVTLLPSANEVGFAVTAVVVDEVPVAVTVIGRAVAVEPR